MKTKLAFLILWAAVLGMSSAVANAATMVTVEMTYFSTINWGDSTFLSGDINIGTDLNGFTSFGTVLYPPVPCAGVLVCTESTVVALPSSGMPVWELNGVMFNINGVSLPVGLVNGSSTGMGPFPLYFATGMSDPGIPMYAVDYYSDPQVGTLEVFATTPLPAALPLFASGLGALGLLGWRRKRKAAIAAA